MESFQIEIIHNMRTYDRSPANTDKRKEEVHAVMKEVIEEEVEGDEEEDEWKA